MSKMTKGPWGYRRAAASQPTFHVYAKGRKGCVASINGNEADAVAIAVLPDLIAAAHQALAALRSSAGPEEKMNAERDLTAALTKVEG